MVHAVVVQAAANLPKSATSTVRASGLRNATLADGAGTIAAPLVLLLTAAAVVELMFELSLNDFFDEVLRADDCFCC